MAEKRLSEMSKEELVKYIVERNCDVAIPLRCLAEPIYLPKEAGKEKISGFTTPRLGGS